MLDEIETQEIEQIATNEDVDILKESLDRTLFLLEARDLLLIAQFLLTDPHMNNSYWKVNRNEFLTLSGEFLARTQQST